MISFISLCDNFVFSVNINDKIVKKEKRKTKNEKIRIMKNDRKF